MADSMYLKIGGILVQMDNTWYSETSIENKTIFQCVVTDKLTLPYLYLGDNITLYNIDDSVIFDGFIKNINKYEPDETGTSIYYKIDAACFCKLADRRLIAGVYEDKSIEWIVTNVILPVLAEEGVVAGTISCEFTINRIKFDYVKASEALNILKNLIYGYNWIISDVTLRLSFYAIGVNYFPKILNDSILHKNFKQNSSISVYRNTQYIRGGKARTTTQNDEIPSPSPDAVVRNYTVRYPIAEEPFIETNILGAGWTSKTCGLNGIDVEGSHDFYFNYNSNIIIQDSTGTILTGSDSIRISYVGLRDLFIKTNDPEQVRRRQEIEADTGQSGIYEVITEDKSIETVEQGIIYASGLIQKYADVADSITFDTEDDDFKNSFGSLLKVEKNLWDINEYFLIENVKVYQLDQVTLGYSITAYDGAYIGGWEQYFAELLNRDKTFNINDSGVLVLLNNQKHNTNWSSEIQINIHNPILEVSETTFVSESTIVGGPIIQGEIVND